MVGVEKSLCNELGRAPKQEVLYSVGVVKACLQMQLVSVIIHQRLLCLQAVRVLVHESICGNLNWPQEISNPKMLIVE